MGKNHIILEGKNLDNLIEEGLSKLNKTKDEVDVEILDEGKSIMGLFKKKYKIKLTPKETETKENHEELEELLGQLGEFNSQNNSFDIKYLNDGVYLSVDRCISSDEILLNRIVNRIERKNIKDYNIDEVKNAVKEKGWKQFKIAPYQEEKIKNEEIIIDIKEKGMFAYITLLPPLGGKTISYTEAMEIIKQKVTFGLLNEEIQNVINNKLYNKEILISKGKNAIDGEDSSINYNFDTVKTTKRVSVMEDGSVDFRNLNLITNVTEGDVLATMVPSTKGEMGFTVTGEIIKPKDGKQTSFTYGKNVNLSDDGMSLIANTDGQVTLDGNKVTIHEIYIVSDDVDNSTGNIEFNGMVSVKGNVRTGFNITTEGDIEVNGVVEACHLNSGSNIILKRGMQGQNKGKLIAKGDIIAKYLENTYLYSEGDIKAEAIMHSEVYGQNSIEITGKKGLLVGGICKAKHEIYAKTIGSTMATSTELEVGVDPNIKAEYENIKTEIQNTEENTEKLDKSITLLSRLAKSNKLTNDKKQLLIKCLNDKNTLTNNLNELKHDLAEIENRIEMLSKGKIHVKDIIYPGVKITIGRSVMFVKKEYKYCTIYLEDGDIKVGPYEM